MLRRIWALTIKEFIHLRNDWWLPVFMLVGGVMELLLVGWATSRPITNLPMMALDLDHSASSRALITALVNTGTFEVDESALTQEDIEAQIISGKVTAGVIIPAGYEAALLDPQDRPELPVILNGAESIPASTALDAVDGVVNSLGTEILLKQLGISEAEAASLEPSLLVWYNSGLSEAFYTIPAELGLMLEFTVLLFAALAFSREKELGTLEQLLVMPFSSLEIIIGKAIPVMIVGFVDFVLMLMMTHLVFGVPIRGSLVLLLVLAMGYLLVELGKGMVISVMSRTQHQAFLLVMLVGMGDFMFTGYAAPVESMPQIVQWFGEFIPAQHWLYILRGIMLKGSGLDVLWPNLLALTGLGVVIITFSLRFVRRSLN
ncbi:ABC transporter permease [bacterium]|nr:ABC transporter permease [bacterium]